MSLPPETIQVKRKIGDQHGPVNFLRVDEPKRQRSGTWLYQRRRLSVEALDASQPRPREETRPVIHTSRTGKEDLPSLTATGVVAAPAFGSSANGDSPGSPVLPPSAPPISTRTGPRRFHMTRPHAGLALTGNLDSRVAKKLRYASAIFVERGAKRKTADPRASEKPQLPDTLLSAPAPTSIEDAEMTDEPARRFKRPGLARGARQTEQGSSRGVQKTKRQLPPSLLNRQQDGNMEQLARDMDAYTLEQIGLNLARTDEDKQAVEMLTKSVSTTPSKYRPKAPAKRYTERHPEAAPQANLEDIEMLQSDTEDENYVIETYIRVPASVLADSVPDEQVGVLVFDNDPDIDFFYGAESDSDEEEMDEEEDSNAEDYYTADYPEDEVDSDDEYDRDPYHYRNDKASDLEEFDEDDVVDSDNESTRGAGGLKALRARLFGVDQFPD